MDKEKPKTFIASNVYSSLLLYRAVRVEIIFSIGGALSNGENHASQENFRHRVFKYFAGFSCSS